MKNVDATGHLKGDSQFIDDILPPQGTLFAVPFASHCAHGRITKLDITEAAQSKGVVRILTAEDIPGENQIGGIIPDEPLLSVEEVHYVGQPLAVVLATSEAEARAAREKIVLEVEEKEVVTDPRDAAAKESLIMPPVVFSAGDVDAAWEDCDLIVEGTAETGGQEHLYLETQGALAIPTEDRGIYLVSSTQGPTAVQTTVSRVLRIPMNKVDVTVRRIGGGFGGKEDQATAWAVMAALGAHLLRVPVKLVLHRLDDMYMTGKRNPYVSDYRLGLKKDGTFVAFEGSFYQNSGAAADLSPAVLGRTLLHANNTYCIPHMRATGYACKTNLPPNTAFRGFGGPQGMFVIEAAIVHAARELGVDASRLQEKNLLKDGDEFHYGMKVESCNARRCWNEAQERFSIGQIRERVEKFNATHSDKKKGMALMPICFGISFTKTQMNQAAALVHAYVDGSVAVNTAAVEMGQGVTTKLVGVVAKTLSISPRRVRIETTATSRIANTFPSAASSEPDLNGKAAEIACGKLKERLYDYARSVLGAEAPDLIELRDEALYHNGVQTDLSWVDLLEGAHRARMSLSDHAHYATPGLHFDPKTNKGQPFAYHSYGTAVIVVTVDCLRGIYDIDSVQMVHDFGTSMNTEVDLGQAEGGLAQGLGWMTLEEVVYSKEGKLLSGSLSTYKIPDIYCVPKELEVHFLEGSTNPLGILNSKAIGEPPLMYGIGVYFALENAIQAFNPKKKFEARAPMTPERVLMSLYGE